MSVIDVDTHWEATGYEQGGHPLEPWRDRLPDPLDYLAFAIAGDLTRCLPADDRPAPRELLPGLVRLAEERGGPIILHPLHPASVPIRHSAQLFPNSHSTTASTSLSSYRFHWVAWVGASVGTGCGGLRTGAIRGFRVEAGLCTEHPGRLLPAEPGLLSATGLRTERGAPSTGPEGASFDR